MAICTVSGTFLNPQGTAVASATVHFNIETPVVDGSGNLLMPKEITTTTASDGTWSLSIIQGVSGNLTLDLNPTVSSPVTKYSFSLVIPTSSTATFAQCWADSSTFTGQGAVQPLTVALGGTGSTSLALNNVLLGNGTASLQVVAPGSSGNVLTSNGTTWASTVPTPSLTIGTIDSQTPSANGAVAAAGALVLQSASATSPGLVNTTTQTLAGNKTLTGTLGASNLSGTNTGDVSLGTANGLSLSGQALSLAASSGSTIGALSGADWTTFNGKQGAGSYITALTSDVTASGPGSATATIANNAVTNAKAAQMAAHTYKGNNTGSTANSLDLTATQLTAELNAVVGDAGSGGTKGLVPAPGSGDAAAGKFLKADGTFAVPAGTGVTAVSVASANGFTGSSSGGATPALTLTTSITGVLKGNGTAISAATSGTDYSAGTSALATGIVKSTTSTGALTIAVAGDFPTLNQNTSGSAASLSATLAVGSGGTGATTLTAHGVVIGNTTSAVNVTSAGSSGQVLTSNGASADPTFQAAASAVSQGNEIKNLGLACTGSSNILTLALKQSDGSTNPSTGSAAVLIGVRSSTAANGNYNERSITAALSQTLTQGTTLGMLASQNNYLWLYYVDSDGAGTSKLALSTTQYADMSLQSTVAESFAATATNASPCVFTATAHGMSNGMAVRITGTPPATGFATGTTYFVVSKAANTFQLAASPTGTAINSTSTGSSIVIHMADGTLVSDAVYTSMPIRTIGRAVFNLSTTGNWTTPSELSVSSLTPVLGSTIACEYNSTAGNTLSSGTVTYLDFPTIETDTNGATFGAGGGNKTTTNTGWRYIVQQAGRYDINGVVATPAGSSGSGKVYCSVFINGTEKMRGSSVPTTDLGSTQSWVSGVSGSFKLALYDRVEIVGFQSVATAQSANAFENRVSIIKIGNA